MLKIKHSNGDIETDKKINHAKDLFLSEPPSLDKMCSACKTLSFVLEPLRQDLNEHFDEKDISDFFQILNQFDVLHNKTSTKSLSMPEQFE
jgi:hypothetical protein